MRVSVPLLQPLDVSSRPGERRIVLSLNGGFLESAVTYVYSVSVSLFGRLGEVCTPETQSVAGHGIERSSRSADCVSRSNVLADIGQRRLGHGV